MTELIIENYTPYAARNATAPGAGSSAYMHAGDICNAEVRDNIPNFATLDMVDGINLLDDSLVFAKDGDNLGYISATVSDFEGAVDQVITVELANGYYDVEKITMRWHKRPCTVYRLTLTKDGAGVSSIMVSDRICDVSELVHVIEMPATDINGLTIEVLRTANSNQLVMLTGVDFGEDISITEFIDPPEIYHEVSMDYTDAPASTMDFTAIIPDGAVPKAGQVIYAYANGRIFGKFRAEEIERQGRDIYAVQCNDDLTMLENLPLPSEFTERRYEDGEIEPSDDCALIAAAAGIVIDPPIDNGARKRMRGFPVLDDNCRQHLARMCCFPFTESRYGCGNYISTSMSRHLHFFGNRRTRKTITADRILGDAILKPMRAPAKAILTRYTGTTKDGPTAFTTINNPRAAGGVIDEIKYEECTIVRQGSNGARTWTFLTGDGYIIPRRGFLRNEITATILWDDEQVGDEIKIETPYDGNVTVILKSITLTLDEEITATVVGLETNASMDSRNA